MPDRWKAREFSRKVDSSNARPWGQASVPATRRARWSAETPVFCALPSLRIGFEIDRSARETYTAVRVQSNPATAWVAGRSDRTRGRGLPCEFANDATAQRSASQRSATQRATWPPEPSAPSLDRGTCVCACWCRKEPPMSVRVESRNPSAARTAAHTGRRNRRPRRAAAPRARYRDRLSRGGTLSRVAERSGQGQARNRANCRQRFCDACGH